VPRKAAVPQGGRYSLGKGGSMPLLVAFVVLLAVAVAGVVFFMLSGGF
jgi:hypothetical protein